MQADASPVETPDHNADLVGAFAHPEPQVQRLLNMVDEHAVVAKRSPRSQLSDRS